MATVRMARYLACRQPLQRACFSSSSSKSAKQVKSFTSKLEVERKFTPNDFFRHQVDESAMYQEQHPRQIKVDGLIFTRHADQHIHDQYFDIDDKIAKKGLWARRRIEDTFYFLSKRQESTTTWEIKQSAGGDYVNSAMIEHEGREKVMELWRQHFSRELDVEGDISADLKTRRKVWTVQEGDHATQQYHVVLDCVTSPSTHGPGGTTFEHMVGEVEMTRVVTGGFSADEHDLFKQEAIEEMDSVITAFMERHPMLFQTTPPPVGKLSAYFAWRRAAASTTSSV